MQHRPLNFVGDKMDEWQILPMAVKGKVSWYIYYNQELVGVESTFREAIEELERIKAKKAAK